MVEILKAVLFGIIEGITEWLPISSTGHMILLNEFVSLDVSPQFWEMFLVVIQLGAILAVILLYWNRLFPFQLPAKGNKENRKNRKSSRTDSTGFLKMDVIQMWIKVIIGCIPVILIGLPFDDLFEELFYNYQTVAIMLILFGIAFIIVENYNKGRKPRMKNISQMTIPTVLIIGIFQLIAGIFPGTSRSGSTIVGALLLGVSRTVAAEFTFFMSVPVMAGASLLKIVKFMAEGIEVSGMEWAILLVGCAVAFIVSVFAIKFLMGYIKKNNFKLFGWYRIGLGILVLSYFMVFEG